MYEHVGSRIMDYGALVVGLSLTATGLGLMIQDAYRSRKLKPTKQEIDLTIIEFERGVGIHLERKNPE
ncbi:MAG: hypothetical protein HY512_00515 [Candidatus Aenigmarchaeota archaeon]|nr:hypothetical protein [Candidatus Aenigmarchaeota archaeon]